MKGCGKDECSKYLIEKYGAVRFALANPLKDLVSEEYDIPRHYMDDRDLKEAPILHLPVTPTDAFTKMIHEFMVKEFRTADGVQPSAFYYEGDMFLGITPEGPFSLYHTPRSLCILKGSTNRAVKTDYWMSKLFLNMATDLDIGNLMIVTDMRYRSEMQAFRENYGDEVFFVRINRHKVNPSSDPSETDLDGCVFDMEIDNTGSLEELRNELDLLVAILKGRSEISEKT